MNYSPSSCKKLHCSFLAYGEFTSPVTEFILQEGDILVVVANHRDMDRAFSFLSPENKKGR